MNDDTEEVTVVIEKEFDQKHASSAWAIVAFGKPYNVVVSGSMDESAIIFDIESGKVLKVIKSDGGWVNHIIKFHSSEYKSPLVLLGGNNNAISSFSIEPPFNRVKQFSKLLGLGRVFNLCRIPSTELFISCEGDGKLTILNHSTGKIEKKLQSHRFDKGWNKLHFSRKYDDSFYVSCDENHAPVKMINWKINKTKKTFLDTDEAAYVYCFSIFVSPNTNEEHICVSSSNALNFFNDKCERYKQLKTDEEVFAITVLQDRYIFTGGDDGSSNLISLETVCSLSKKKMNERKIYDSTVLEISENYARIAFVAGQDVVIAKIRGLEFLNSLKEKQSRIDTEERISFLNESSELFEFDCETKLFFEVLLRNITLKILKVLFC